MRRYKACSTGKITMKEVIQRLQAPGNIASNDV
jgi:hypothetical protein